MLAQGFNGTGSPQLDSWIAIAADGTVTAYTGKCEFGQGLYTAQMQLVAEELGVPFDRVRLIQCDTSMTPDQGTTSGQQSHPTNFNHTNLALAAATARETLVRLASTRLGAPPQDLVAKDGAVSVKATPSRSVAYGALVGGRKFDVQLDPKAARKHPREWTVLGTPVPRVDMRAMATGQFEFVHNVRVPGMLHGRVVRPPSPGATVVSVDESSVRGMPGLVKVVVKNNFVGVVAEKPWQAMQAAEKLQVTWTPGPRLSPQRDAYQQIRKEPSTRHAARGFRRRGHDARVGGDRAARDLSPSVSDARLDRQLVRRRRRAGRQGDAVVGDAVGVPDAQHHGRDSRPEAGDGPRHLHARRRLLRHQRRRHGDLRRRRAVAGGRQAGARAAVAQGRDGLGELRQPLRDRSARRSRRERHDRRVGLRGVVGGAKAAGPATTRRQRRHRHAARLQSGAVQPAHAGAGADDAAQQQSRTPRRRTSPDASRDVAERRRRRAQRARAVAPRPVAVLHRPAARARAAAEHVRARVLHGRSRGAREGRSGRVSAAPSESRALERGGPHGGEGRQLAGAAVAAGRASAATGVVSGRGIACVCYEGDNGYVAMVAEVDVNQDTGQVHVTRLVVAQDCGPISNPDGMRNQIEGGALQGMSRALGEEVTWDEEKVTSIDWRTYRSLPLGFAIPRIEAVLINQPDEEACGSGETSITVVAAAIGNAIFDATGARIREVPFTPERVKSALGSRT